MLWTGTGFQISDTPYHSYLSTMYAVRARDCLKSELYVQFWILETKMCMKSILVWISDTCCILLPTLQEFKIFQGVAKLLNLVERVLK